jgi:hypothetical protein
LSNQGTGSGSGLYLYNFEQVLLNNVTVNNNGHLQLNDPLTFGGAMYIKVDGKQSYSFALNNVRMINNVAGFGGAMHVDVLLGDERNNQFECVDVAATGNVALFSGGLLHLSNGAALTNASHDTINCVSRHNNNSANCYGDNFASEPVLLSYVINDTSVMLGHTLALQVIARDLFDSSTSCADHGSVTTYGVRVRSIPALCLDTSILCNLNPQTASCGGELLIHADVNQQCLLMIDLKDVGPTSRELHTIQPLHAVVQVVACYAGFEQHDDVCNRCSTGSFNLDGVECHVCPPVGVHCEGGDNIYALPGYFIGGAG